MYIPCHALHCLNATDQTVCAYCHEVQFTVNKLCYSDPCHATVENVERFALCQFVASSFSPITWIALTMELDELFPSSCLLCSLSSIVLSVDLFCCHSLFILAGCSVGVDLDV